MENLGKKLLRDNDFFTTFDKYYFALKQLKTCKFWKKQLFLGLKRQKIVRVHKTCLASQFLNYVTVSKLRHSFLISLTVQNIKRNFVGGYFEKKNAN